jgi:localization factor PodJL
MAIAAYQRDQGLPASGGVDAETLNRLSVYAR